MSEEKELEVEETTEEKEERIQKYMNFIVSQAHEAFDKLIEAEIEAQPENKSFLEGVKDSQFFRNLHKRGFTSGMYFEKFMKDKTLVL